MLETFTDLLKMQGLSEAVAQFLLSVGLSSSNAWFAVVHFFLYDTIKISLLLYFFVFLVSWLQSYFPPERTRSILLRHRGWRANTLAALLGTITPFCSCSSIPLFMGFTRAGLPRGVTFSFLISSPMVDLGALLILISVFNLKIAMAYVVMGLISAVVGGQLIEKFNPQTSAAPSTSLSSTVLEQSISARARFAFTMAGQVFRNVFLFVVIGVGLGAFIHNVVPTDWVLHWLGADNAYSVLTATLIGVPMYADIFGVIPVAQALLAKGAPVGTVVAFMMAVTTLSAPSLILLHRVISQRVLWTFVGVCTLTIVFNGFILNAASAWFQ